MNICDFFLSRLYQGRRLLRVGQGVKVKGFAILKLHLALLRER